MLRELAAAVEGLLQYEATFADALGPEQAAEALARSTRLRRDVPEAGAAVTAVKDARPAQGGGVNGLREVTRRRRNSE